MPHPRCADGAAGYGACVRSDAAASVPPPKSKLPACDAAAATPPSACTFCPRSYTSSAAPLWARPECVPKQSPYAVTFGASVDAACDGMAVLAVQSAAQDMLSALTAATPTDIVVSPWAVRCGLHFALCGPPPHNNRHAAAWSLDSVACLKSVVPCPM